MKILMLCPLISSSSFITTYPFAKILAKRHEVEIVGPLLGNPPYIEDSDLNITYIEPTVKNPIQLAFMLLKKKNLNVLRRMDFDVIHAFKLLPHTGPVGAKISSERGIPFVLSIDDYDAAASKQTLKRYILKRAEASYKKADAITVASERLKKIYGGDIIYQVANEFVFNKKHDTTNFVKKYNLEGKFIIAHAGTFFDHKGIDILIRAVQKLNNKKLKLVLAGNSNIERYKKIAGGETLFTGKIPITEAAQLTQAADIYVIPTKNTPYAQAEIPAKIFEPMMAGKPIIASRVSDIPKILENGKCGILAEPGSVKSVADAIQYLIDNPGERKELGNNAQKRYKEKYSYKTIEEKLNRIYSSIR